MRPGLAVLGGPTPYRRVLELQRGWAAGLAEGRLEPLLWVGSHPPVITLGQRADESELKVSPAELARRGVDLEAIERGGLATLHAPGQLVAYPIIPVRGLGVREFVWRLEEAMLRTLAGLGLQARRDQRNPGLWVGDNKIGFLGVAIRRGVSLHGLALNLNPDLGLFDLIVPCGLGGIGVVSAQSLLGRPIDLARAGQALAGHLASLLELDLTMISLEEAEERLAQTGT